jgi:DNA-binding MarR family transcriptional regulator
MQDFIYALLMMQSSYRQAIQKKLREFNIDLTFEMLQIMKCLYRKDRVNQQELANQTFKDKSSLSYLLNNMEKRQLVERVEDDVDKRNKLVVLTDEGQALHEQIKLLIETVYSKVEQEIDMQKLQLCTNYMKELSEIVSND